MSKIILITGKICCGKTSYAAQLCADGRAVALSCDELMLTLWPEGCGEAHDMYAERVKQYLLQKAAELCAADLDVVLDWGPWTRAGRAEICDYFRTRGIACELHHLAIPDTEWQRRIAKRNAAGAPGAYFVDEGLLQKFAERYEVPSCDEADVGLTNA